MASRPPPTTEARSRKAQDTPQSRYGKIRDWLKRGGGSSEGFEAIRSVLRQHIRDNWALAPGSFALDEPVLERRYHSLQSLSKSYGVHHKRLGKLLEREGFLDLDAEGPDRLIAAISVEPILNGLLGGLSGPDVKRLLGAGHLRLENLVKAGILRPVGGEAGTQSPL